MNDRFKTIIESFSDSERDIRVLPADYDVLRRINETYDIDPDNTFGSLLNNSGGIVIDNWIRLYGAGKLNFLERNKLCPFSNIVVGEDICGGLFIILDSGTLGYFAPDSLEIEDMEITFAQFLHWCTHGDIDLYYKEFRWKGWKEDISDLSLDCGVAFYPFLWAQAESIDSRSRRFIPMSEIISLEFDFVNQMG